jgi:hypothetical protein
MLDWDLAETINIIISSVVGLGLSYFAAWSYESFVNKRKKRDLERVYRQYESSGDHFDYQHWNIIDGKIAETPLDSFMRIKYRENNVFDFEWIESKNGEVKGTGMLVFDDFVRGRLFFFANSGSIDFNSRDFVYSEWIEHQMMYYTGIFINAADQGTRYVMMRHRNWPH